MIDIDEIRNMTKASQAAVEKELQKEELDALPVIKDAITSKAKDGLYSARVRIGDGLFMTRPQRPDNYIEVSPLMVEPVVERLKKGLNRLGFIVTSEEIQFGNVRYTNLEISWGE